MLARSRSTLALVALLAALGGCGSATESPVDAGFDRPTVAIDRPPPEEAIFIDIPVKVDPDAPFVDVPEFPDAGVIVRDVPLARDTSAGEVGASTCARFTEVPPPSGAPANLDCLSAQVVTGCTILRGLTSPTTTTPVASCFATSPPGVNPLWYRVTVPAGRTLQVTLQPPGSDGGFYSDAIAFLHENCPASVATCLAEGAFEPGLTNASRWTNASAVAQEIFFAIAANPSNFTHRFSLDFSVEFL